MANEMYEWRKYKEYYTETKDGVVFKEDTPDFVLESYQMYQDQIESLESFTTRRTGAGLLSVFDNIPKIKKGDKVDHCLEHAQSFVQYRNQQREIPKNWVEFDVKYYDGNGNCFEGIQEFPSIEKSDYRITESIHVKNKVVILWKKPGYSMATVFLFHEDKIKVIRDFISKS